MADYATTKSFEPGTTGRVPIPRGRFSDSIWAYTILRLSFGANIVLHGVSRLMAGHAAFLAYLNHYFEKTPAVPASLLPAFAWALPDDEPLNEDRCEEDDFGGPHETMTARNMPASMW